MQVTTGSPNASMVVAGSETMHRKKQALGGLMNPEEAKMNRALLKEIARAKRGDDPTDLLDHKSKVPI